MNTSGFQRHSSLYLADGNICLSAASSRFIAPVDGAAEPTQPAGLLFRVHRSVLALHSPVFRDMFGIPDMSGANETYDGISLVQMPDSAEDLEGLLKAFYHGYKLPYPRLDPRTPDAVRSILLMANKYQVDSIRQQIVERLESDWPQSFVDWQRQQAEFQVQLEYFTHTNDANFHYEKPSRLDNAFPEPASAIRLARECDIPSILPAAFYHLSRLTIDDDWDTARRKHDPTTHPWVVYSPATHRTVRWPLLTAEDLRCMLAGKAAIRKRVLPTTAIGFCPQDYDDPIDEDDEDAEEICQMSSRHSDGSYAKRLREQLLRERDIDLLECIRDIQRDLAERTLCATCEQRFKTSLDGDATWRKFPVWFGLV